MATVTIDVDECIGCEVCVETCPEVFEFDEDEGKAVVLEAADFEVECVEEAIATCPAECIIKE